MRANYSFRRRWVAGIAPLFAGVGLCAAPLTWFPGPSLNAPLSGAAALGFSGNNLLIGGDSYGAQDTLVQELAATNNFWTYPQSYLFYYSTLAPGAVDGGGTVIYYGGHDGTRSAGAAISYSPSDRSPLLTSMSVARSYLGYAPDKNGNA